MFKLYLEVWLEAEALERCQAAFERGLEDTAADWGSIVANGRVGHARVTHAHQTVQSAPAGF